MGFSKKKSKAFVKATARVGAKAKEKAKKTRQIEAANQVRESKRKANALTGKAERKPRGDSAEQDVLDEIKSVDDLFAKLGASDAEDGDDDDESSAGAFHDVGDGDEEDGPEDIEPYEEDETDPKKHEAELKAIREKDPEFYKFLVEQDRSLLDFRAPDDDDEEEEEAAPGDDAEAPAAGADEEAAPSSARILTSERFGRIKDTARQSFTACKAALNAYHAAVRSIEKAPEDDPQDEEEDDGEGGKSAAARRRRKRKTLIQIDSEGTFSEVLEWSVANMLGVLQLHAGELKMQLGGRRKGKKGKKADGEEGDEPSGPSGVVDPSLYDRWLRVKVLAQIFWEETLFLLNHLTAQHMVEYVLRHCSTPESLSWLWPFKSLRSRYLKRCCALWSSASSHSVRLLAFLLIRNSAAMTLHAPEAGISSKDAGQLETLVRNVLRTFADTAAGGYSWRALSTFRFMENCMVELLTLEDATTYRVGYVWVRQLALILRNACIATSQGGEAAKAGSSEKGGKKKGLQQKQAQSLVSWPFVRSLYLWTKAVGSVKALRPLSYPLSMITMGAVKSKLTNLQHFPFVFHCLQCLNKMAASMEVFVPVSSYLLKVMSVLLQAMDKAHRKKGQPQGKPAKGFGGTRAPEVEVLLRFSEAQLNEVLTLETIGNSLCFLLTDHLGLLSQSPAFPEVSALVLLHLRRYSKHCRSEPLRRQLKTLVEKAEVSADDIRARREQLAEAPSAKKFLVFEPDSDIAKARAEQLRRRSLEERSRVEAELRDTAKAKGDKEKGGKAKDGRPKAQRLDDLGQEEGEEEAAPGHGTSKKAQKRRKKRDQASGKDAEKEQVVDAGSLKKSPAKRRKALAKAPKGDKDVVEEMGFGSEDSDE